MVTARRAHTHRKKLRMNYNPQIHQPRSIRLPGFDYTQPGAYFVTICAHGRDCLFGKVADGDVVLNHLGRLDHEEWTYTEIVRPEVELDEFVIMPNHIHGIITIPRPCAPTLRRRSLTTSAEISRFVNCGIQIRGNKTNQSIPSHTRPARMATELLRTRHQR